MDASVQSTQMDSAEAVSQLKGARQLGAAGLASHDASRAPQQHAEAMDLSAQGKHDGPTR